MPNAAGKRTAKEIRDSPTAVARRQRKLENDRRKNDERILARQATFAAKLFKALADGRLTPETFPCGQANCLAGMRFKFIGFEHRILDHDQLVGLMKHYGGKYQAVASKETSWVVMRGIPDPVDQLTRVLDLGVPLTNEAGLFELIRKLPGSGPAQVVARTNAPAARSPIATTPATSILVTGLSASTPRLTASAVARTVGVAATAPTRTTPTVFRTVLAQSRNGANVRSPMRAVVVKSEPNDEPENVHISPETGDNGQTAPLETPRPQLQVMAKPRVSASTSMNAIMKSTTSGLAWLPPVTKSTGVLKRTYTDRGGD